ncbi:MAG: TetR/AcrR family transcriptional regulator, partial [Alphaproteobacteria bacterium]
MAKSKRDHLVDTAARLFYREGFHATGIDRLLAEAGVAKMTLYNNFASKDELVIAAIERAAQWLMEGVSQALEKAGSDPRARVAALFDFYDDLFRSGQFHGCMFVNAAGEYGSHAGPVYEAAARRKRDFRDLCVRLVGEAGIPNADGLGRQISLLLEGAIVAAH